MGKIQDLYTSRVRPMLPAERLQLVRMILDELAPTDLSSGDNTAPGDVTQIRSPRLANPEQLKDFAKQVLEPDSDAALR